MRNTKIIFFTILLLVSQRIFGNDSTTVIQNSYFKFQSGLLFDSYNNNALRLYYEYNCDFKNSKHWAWGVASEHKWYMARVWTDDYSNPKLNSNSFTYNIHYKVFAFKDKLFWDVYSGAGFVHMFNDNKKSYQAVGTFGITLNVKLSKRIYFETAPLIIFPPISQVSVSNNQLGNKPGGLFVQFTFIPFGLMIKL